MRKTVIIIGLVVWSLARSAGAAAGGHRDIDATAAWLHQQSELITATVSRTKTFLGEPMDRLSVQGGRVVVDVMKSGNTLKVNLLVKGVWTQADADLLRAICRHVAGDAGETLTTKQAAQLKATGQVLDRDLPLGRLEFAFEDSGAGGFYMAQVTSL